MLFCPTHPQTRLLYMLKGDAGFCFQCRHYVQAAGVPEPKPTKVAGSMRKANKARKARKKEKAR